MARLLRAAALAAAALAAPALLRAQAAGEDDYRDLRFRGLGPEIGWVLPTEVEPAVSYGLRADMGFVGPGIRVTPAIRYWRSHLRQGELDRVAEQIVSICERQGNTDCPMLDLGSVERSDLELSADAHLVLEATPTLSLYAGAGLSLHLFNGRGELIDGTFVEDLLDTAAPGLDLIAGASVPLGPLALFAETRLIVTSDIQYANATAALSWTLPTAPPEAALAGRPPVPFLRTLPTLHPAPHPDSHGDPRCQTTSRLCSMD